MLNLDKLDRKITVLLASETEESLTTWILKKRQITKEETLKKALPMW